MVSKSQKLLKFKIQGRIYKFDFSNPPSGLIHLMYPNEKASLFREICKSQLEAHDIYNLSSLKTRIDAGHLNTQDEQYRLNVGVTFRIDLGVIFRHVTVSTSNIGSGKQRWYCPGVIFYKSLAKFRIGWCSNEIDTVVVAQKNQLDEKKDEDNDDNAILTPQNQDEILATTDVQSCTPSI